jgi:uncharacterized protein YutE (UPF0331/DUF86 family)
VERDVEVIIQGMIDIGNHILAKKFIIRPKSFAEVFLFLHEKKIISNLSIGRKSRSTKRLYHPIKLAS